MTRNTSYLTRLVKSLTLCGFLFGVFTAVDTAATTTAAPTFGVCCYLGAHCPDLELCCSYERFPGAEPCDPNSCDGQPPSCQPELHYCYNAGLGGCPPLPGL